MLLSTRSSRSVSKEKFVSGKITTKKTFTSPLSGPASLCSAPESTRSSKDVVVRKVCSKDLEKYACKHKKYILLDDILYSEAIGVYGSTIIIKLGKGKETSGVNMSVYKSTKTTAIDRRIREMAVKHACGMTGMFVSQGPSVYLYYGDTPYGSKDINANYYTLNNTQNQKEGHLKMYPVITYEELRMDSRSISVVCDKVMRDIEDVLITKTIDTTDKLQDTYTDFSAKFFPAAERYFEKQDKMLGVMVQEIRKSKAIVEESIANEEVNVIEKGKLQQLEKTMQIMYEHMNETITTIEHLNNLSTKLDKNYEHLKSIEINF